MDVAGGLHLCKVRRLTDVGDAGHANVNRNQRILIGRRSNPRRGAIDREATRQLQARGHARVVIQHAVIVRPLQERDLQALLAISAETRALHQVRVLETAVNPMLSSDGLRMVFSGTTMPLQIGRKMYYAERADLSKRFGSATELADVPVVDGAYLTDDCARIYLSGLNSLFYVQRQ